MGWGSLNPFKAAKSVVNEVSNLGSSIDDAVTQPVVNTVKDVGSAIDDELGRALADPVIGPIATVIAGIYGGPAAVAALKYKQTGELSDALEAAAKAYIIQNVASEFATPATDPNAVGGVTGPDNIDVGGGWSPATGATAAELAAARLALESGDVANTAAGNPYQAAGFNTTPVDASTVKSSVSSYQTPPVNTGNEAGSFEDAFGDANAADNIDVGGGFNPATGTGDAATAAAAAANPPIMPTVDSVISNIAGNADRAALNSNAGYGDTMTSAQIDAYDKAIAAGLSASDALNYARLGLMVNAFVGDPLGLSGNTGGGSAAPTGFAQVDIPAEWKSPTYAAPSAPIDLNSIFSNQNMLGGTQWKGLPSQQNVSFNDIFAAGQQQTPMGTPVDINQIVSSILGQATTSQKPA